MVAQMNGDTWAVRFHCSCDPPLVYCNTVINGDLATGLQDLRNCHHGITVRVIDIWKNLPVGKGVGNMSPSELAKYQYVELPQSLAE